jgi:hypothetical protein
MLSRDDDPKASAPKCAACANPAECEVWGTPVCYPCASDWRDESPTYGDIAAKHGPNADNVSVYQAFTKAWLERRRRGAA